MPDEAADDGIDATRRTRLANERTYLAWWRGGLTALAVSVGVGALPAVTAATRWPFLALGIGFGLLGIAFIAFGARRYRAVERALARGAFAPLEARLAAVLGLFGVLLALLTIIALATDAS
jgi:putative membrane protein